MQKIVSVIVPVYNVEKYLEKCVESILNQTYKNLEIILVDDGATDGSGNICDELAKKDERIKVYHKVNGGLSDARNYGVERANGEYIQFIDSDDYIEKEMIEDLVSNIEKYDADVSCCHYNNIYENNAFPQVKDTTIKALLNKREFLENYLYDTFVSSSMCTKLLKKEIASKLKFPKGKLYEDAFYHLDLSKVAEKYICITKPYYYYYHRENSITTKPFRKGNMHVIEAYTNFYNFIIENYKELEPAAFFRLIYSYFGVFDKIIMVEDYKNIQEYKEVRDYLKKNTLRIIRDKDISKARKIGAAVLFFSTNLYKKLITIDKNKKKIN